MADHEVIRAEADIYLAKAALLHAEARLCEVNARRLLMKKCDAEVQAELKPEVKPEMQEELQTIEIKGVYCPKWTRRPQHYQIALQHSAVAEKVPLQRDYAFFSLIGQNIVFLGITGDPIYKKILSEYAYHVNVTETIHGQVSFTEFAAHYNLSQEIQKQLMKPRVGPKIDNATSDAMMDIAIKIIESGKLLA